MGRARGRKNPIAIEGGKSRSREPTVRSHMPAAPSRPSGPIQRQIGSIQPGRKNSGTTASATASSAAAIQRQGRRVRVTSLAARNEPTANPRKNAPNTRVAASSPTPIKSAIRRVQTSWCPSAANPLNAAKLQKKMTGAGTFILC